MKFLCANIRLYKTLCVFLLCLQLGIKTAIGGSSLVHMEYVLHTDTQGMAMSMMLESVTGLIGIIFCAYYCEWLGRWESQFSLILFIMAGCTAVMPYTPNIYWFCVVIGVRSLFIGYVATAAKAYVLNLWHGDNRKDTIFQGYITTWSLGAFIAPIMAIPFLCHLPEHHNKGRIKRELNITDKEITNEDLQKLLEEEPFPQEVFQVRHLFILAGFLLLVVSVMFFFTRNRKHRFISVMPQEKKNAKQLEIESDGSTLLNSKLKRLRFSLLVIIFFYNCLTEWPSTILGSFISAFVIKGLGWSTEKGPLILSVFRGSQGIGRVMSVFISIYVSSSNMLITNLTLGLISYIVMLLSVTFYHSNLLLWCSTALAGFAVASTYSTLMIWGSQHLHTSAAYCSLFSASSNTGSMVASAIAGYLFQNYSPIALIYMLLFAGTLNVVTYIVMSYVGSVYSKHLGYTVYSEELTIHVNQEKANGVL